MSDCTGSRTRQVQGPRQRSQADATCRTCRRCRRKKVKCDGQHPRCGTCRARDHDCEYPHDARRTATRPQRSDVEALQKQIQLLQDQIRKQSDTVFTGGSSNAGSSYLNRAFNAPRNMTPAPIDRLDTVVQHSASSTTLRNFQAVKQPPFGVTTTQTADQDILGQDYELDNDERNSSSSDAEAASGEVRIQVYGETSLLHHQSSKAMSTDAPPISQDEERLLREAARDRLVAYAAIRRQEEIALSSSPSTVANIDFDGVPMGMAMHLLDLHWNRQHLSYLISYRPAIMDSLIHGGPYVNKLLLNAIYFSSSPYSDRTALRSDPQDPQTVGLVFYDRFKDLLAYHIDRPTIPTVVGLLICGSSLVPHGKQSAGWVLCGVAYRMMNDLGCHLEIPVSSQNRASVTPTPFDVEIRKRIYWGAFVCDKFQSLFLGRPPALHASAATVSSELLDTYEEMEEWKPYVDPLAQPFDGSAPAYPGRPVYAISTFQCLLRLCGIAGRIIDAFYSIRSAETPVEILLQTRHEIKAELYHWRNSLPTHLRLDPNVDATPPPHQITPHTTYWTLVILVEQAFLNNGHFNCTLDMTSQAEGKERCIEAALQIWRLVQAYKKAFTLRRAQYGISYATYCAVLVMLQHTQQNCDDYVECIWFFWSALLEYQKGCSCGLKKPLRILKSLIHRLKGLSQPLNGRETETTVRTNSSGQALHFAPRMDPGNINATSEAGLESIVGPETVSRDEIDIWDNRWFDSVTDDGSLANDLIFGLFMVE